MERSFAVRNSSKAVGSLERGLDILEVLGDTAGLPLTEIANRLGLPKGSVHRQLAILERRGYVTRVPETKRYSLGPRLIHLGFSSRQQLRLPEVARPFMEQLRDKFNESVHLGVMDSGQVVHVAAVESRHPVKMAAAVGERTFAHASALGKALLTWGDPDTTEAVISSGSLERLTATTRATAEELTADMHESRARGFTVDDEESSLGLRCIAAPVRGPGGVAVAALSLSSPVDRLPPENVERTAPLVQEAAKSISRELGWRDEVAGP